MTTIQKRKILERLQSLEADIAKLKQCRIEVATGGYASATLSSGGGNKSYTRLDLAKITELIVSLQRETRQLRNLLAGKAANPIESHYICWG